MTLYTNKVYGSFVSDGFGLPDPPHLVVVTFMVSHRLPKGNIRQHRCCLPRLRHAALRRVPGEPVFGLLTL